MASGIFFSLTSFIPQETVHTVAALFSIYSILNKNKSYCLKLTSLCLLLYYLFLLLCVSFCHSPRLPPLLFLSLFAFLLSYPPLHLNAFGSVVPPPFCVKVCFLNVLLSLTSVSACYHSILSGSPI